MTSRAAAWAFAVALASLPAGALAQDEANWAKLLKDAPISTHAAIDAALKAGGEGVPYHIELEEDEGKAVYSVDVAQGVKTSNVVIDAKAGTVVEKQVEEDDHSTAVKALGVTLEAAIETATKQSPGRVVEAKLSLKGGKPVVMVNVFADGTLAVVAIDGANGHVLVAPPPPPPAGERAFTDTFSVEAGEWASKGTNPFFVLEPGHVLVLEGRDEGEDARLTITVLAETKEVAGVETRVVEEREEHGGRIVEVSRNYFAISKRTNDVYYFGEDVDIYRDGKVHSHDGAWLAGVNGARYGLMMPGTPLLGARYCQEVAPGVAMDRAEIVGLAESLETPAGTFPKCLGIDETTPIEKGTEHKVYAPGVGLVKAGNLRLARKP